LPLMPNGKVDRRALPAPEGRAQGVAYEAPRTELERSLARIWGQVLGVDRVGLHDDFFALGGHSLLATSTLARVRSQLGIDVGIRVLFESPVLAAFAQRIAAIRDYLDAAEMAAGVTDAEYDEGVL
jgi:surfactin family lipopeptide synthetase C